MSCLSRTLRTPNKSNTGNRYIQSQQSLAYYLTIETRSFYLKIPRYKPMAIPLSPRVPGAVLQTQSGPAGKMEKTSQQRVQANRPNES